MNFVTKRLIARAWLGQFARLEPLSDYLEDIEPEICQQEIYSYSNCKDYLKRDRKLH